MTFISYAQNFEDVMLWRALKHIRDGFYIDIGAGWPDQDSVTRCFYDRGWTGINAEPNPEMHRELAASRTRDTNLRLALGSHEGAARIHIVSGTSLSTLRDDLAEKYRQAGRSMDLVDTQVTTLAALWRENVPAGRDVHFLKVDVEGLEAAVIRGNDWAINRPWIVVLEATLPETQVESHAEWEPILVAADYLFAYADGLNRFYLAKEHEDLLRAFKYPPNVFDDFVSYHQVQAETRANDAEFNSWRDQCQIALYETSLSWRITRPLRILEPLRRVNVVRREHGEWVTKNQPASVPGAPPPSVLQLLRLTSEQGWHPSGNP